jgi:predicted nuclease with TOPRIM domain
LPHLDSFAQLLLGGAVLALALVVVFLVRRQIVRATVASAPTDADVRSRVHAWLAAAPRHVPVLPQMVHEHGQLRARAEAAEHALAPLRDRAERAEKECQQLRHEVNRRNDQLEELRKDWEKVTQRVSQLLLQLLEKKHDA